MSEVDYTDGRRAADDAKQSGETLASTAVRLSPAARLAQAVLLFHGPPPWTKEQRLMWQSLTGEASATTRALCDFARRVLRGGEERAARAAVLQECPGIMERMIEPK